jgi:hypothetical protein
MLFKKFLLTSFLAIGVSIRVTAFPGGDFLNSIKNNVGARIKGAKNYIGSKSRSAYNSASDGWTSFKSCAGPKVKSAYKSVKDYAGIKFKSASKFAKDCGYNIYLKNYYDLGLIDGADREKREIFVFGRDAENAPFVVLESKDGFKFDVPEWVGNYSDFVENSFKEEGTNGYVEIKKKGVTASALYLVLKCIAIFYKNYEEQDQNVEKLEDVGRKNDVEDFLASQNDRLNHWYNIDVWGLRQKFLDHYLRDIILTVDFLRITNVDIVNAIVFEYSKFIVNVMSKIFNEQTNKIKDENLVYKIVEASSKEIFDKFKELGEEFEDEDNENENSSLKDEEEKEFFDN